MTPLTLFAAVHLERLDDGTSTDSLRGFYSGHAVWLDPSLDPTTTAWNASPRYSTEHLWPENRGATDGTDAYRDLHHLAPVMQSVNSSRSDHPFGEVVDAEADRWWGPDGQTHTSMPTASVRDLYTEKRNGTTALLEPRESVAGDVARAMFYVWTVYGPNGADQLDADFWAAQREVLLDWHEQDPADDAETDRTLIIEGHQGTANPFVLDATLAARAFGPPGFPQWSKASRNDVSRGQLPLAPKALQVSVRMVTPESAPVAREVIFIANDITHKAFRFYPTTHSFLPLPFQPPCILFHRTQHDT